MFKIKTQSSHDEIEISNQEFDKIKNNALIIDVRDVGEYAVLKKIANPNAELEIINVPYYELIKNPSKYIKNKDIIIITICNAGNRSTAAAINLREQGYKKSYVLNNGIYGYYRK